MMQESADKQIKLVKSEAINASPFPAHGEEENGDILKRKGEIEGEEGRRELLDEVCLIGELISMPKAVKEAFPELFHVVVGNLLGNRRKP